VHEGLRPFQCEQCDATFGHKNLLVEHVRTQHLGERPFLCESCGATFGRKSNLYQHVQMVHEQRRSFECDICKVSFGLKGNLYVEFFPCSTLPPVVRPGFFLGGGFGSFPPRFARE
jgi:uncharacterized Zn-finger protein